MVQFCILRPLVTAVFVKTVPHQYQPFRVVLTELSLFTGAGLFLMVFNHLVYAFPLESGLRLTLGLAAVGFFIVSDLSLAKARELSLYLTHTGGHIEPDKQFLPLPFKFAYFSFASALLVAGILFLVINKDLDWLIITGNQIPLPVAQRSILIEIGFVVAIIFLFVINIIFSYAKNLSLFFGNENRVLKAAAEGDLYGYVPPSTNDEFGVMAKHTNQMISRLRQHNEEVQRTQDVTIMTLASLAETRDNETGTHIQRTQRYVKLLAEQLRKHPCFSHYLTEATIDLLFKSAPLHDIGKVGIPDAILLKPGKLTAEEFDIMKTHAQLGGDALHVAEEKLGSSSFLRIAKEIAYAHHEKWDGTGYPNQLQGDEIPISGRLMALADVYDALISKRVYKPAFSHQKAVNIILEGRGSHFDPDVVDAFLEREREFKAVARAFKDEEAEVEVKSESLVAS